jgi:hypothetical protein
VYLFSGVKLEHSIPINRLEVYMVILLIINLISMVLCYLIAKHRKSKILYWLLASLLVGPLAIPFVFFSKPVNEPE